MAKAGAGRARSRLVKAQTWLRQDDCGGLVTARLCDAVAGTPGRRHWATQGLKAAAGLGCRARLRQRKMARRQWELKVRREGERK